MKIHKLVIISIILGIIFSAIVASISQFGLTAVFWGSAALYSILFFVLIYLFSTTPESRFLGWVIILALIFRLGLGLITTFNLLDWGYESDPYESGYLFKDAFTRDNQAWELASSDKPIWTAFTNDFFSDQYGGLLAISSFVYRLFTPNAHMQFNIIFFVSVINIIGILYFAKGLLNLQEEARLSKKSKWMILIFTFYPDAILFSSSQMREPILLGLSAILFWVVHSTDLKIKKRLFLFLIMSVLLISISFKIGLFIIFSFFIWMLFKNYLKDFSFMKPKYFIPAIIVFVVIAVYFSFNWIVEAAKWDALLLERNSGFVQYIISIIGERYRLAFASLYGLFQPVLPAALIEPSKLFWRILNSLRALGWYLIIPGLVYGIIFFLREKDKEKRIQFGIFWFISIFWIVLSSIRAGGDMWDNPRYRISFLLLISYIFVEGFSNGWQKKDHWLKKILIAETIFVLFFLQWYIARYLGVFDNLPIMYMAGILISIFILLIVIGVIQELMLRKNRKLNNFQN